jgi:hypothetical protein
MTRVVRQEHNARERDRAEITKYYIEKRQCDVIHVESYVFRGQEIGSALFEIQSLLGST